MLVFNPLKRISVDDALQHPYMSTRYSSDMDLPVEVPIDMDID